MRPATLSGRRYRPLPPSFAKEKGVEKEKMKGGWKERRREILIRDENRSRGRSEVDAKIV